MYAWLQLVPLARQGRVGGRVSTPEQRPLSRRVRCHRRPIYTGARIKRVRVLTTVGASSIAVPRHRRIHRQAAATQATTIKGSAVQNGGINSRREEGKKKMEGEKRDGRECRLRALSKAMLRARAYCVPLHISGAKACTPAGVVWKPEACSRRQPASNTPATHLPRECLSAPNFAAIHNGSHARMATQV